MVQNNKTFCLSYSVSQKPYIIWLPFMVHMCKVIISPGGFFIFSKFWFSGSIGKEGWGVKGRKTVQKTKNYVCDTPYLRNHTSYDFNVKILIFQVVKGLKGQKMAQSDKNLCLLYLIFEEPYIKWSSFMVRMYI